MTRTARMAENPLSPDSFAEIANVSRETLDRLRIYADHLARWQTALNLVSRTSLGDVWRRHMLDSAQVVPYLPATGRIADLGSGAGFPGLVVAIVGGRPVELVESDARKCAFLREAVRLTGAPATVTDARIDARAAAIDPGAGPGSAGESGKKSVDIVTARALAPLATLCGMAVSLGAETCVFLKGERWREELTAAEKDWKMAVETFDSLTAPGGRILRLRHVTRRP